MIKTTNTAIRNHGRTMEIRMIDPTIEENVEENLRKDSVETHDVQLL
jgi:hypothetical protein